MKSTRRSLALFLAMVLLFSTVSYVIAEDYQSLDGYVFVVSNDAGVDFPDSKPEVKDGTTYVPVRFFAQSLGAQIGWDEETQVATITKGDKKILIHSAEGTVEADGTAKVFDMFLKDNRIMVPYRYIAEYFGFTVSYISEGNIARVKNSDAKLSDEEVLETNVDKILTEKKTIAQKLGDTKAVADINKKLDERKAVIEKLEKERLEKEAKEALLAKKAEIDEKYKKVKQTKKVYLTMDDGPNTTNTDKVLDVLAIYDMKCTFFLKGNNMLTAPAPVIRMYADGHAVGLHSITHNKTTSFLTDTTLVTEFEQCNENLVSIGGQKTTLARVPFGSGFAKGDHYNNLVNAGYKLWDWHIDPRDYAQTMDTKELIYDTITSQISDGEVILLHDTAQTLAILPKVLDYLRANGYKGMPLTEDMAPYNSRTK